MSYVPTRRSLLLAPVVACASALIIGVTPSLGTTAPSVLNQVRVVLTSTAIEIPKDQFVTANGETRYPRGAMINFNLFNESKTPVSVRLIVAGATSATHNKYLKLSGSESAGAPIPVGGVGHLRVAFDFRGIFAMEIVSHGKVIVRRPIIIF